MQPMLTVARFCPIIQSGYGLRVVGGLIGQLSGSIAASAFLLGPLAAVLNPAMEPRLHQVHPHYSQTLGFENPWDRGS
jgi:hypothetical protein